MEELLAAALGRKTLEKEMLDLQYNRLLVLLAAVVSGEMDRSRVTVDVANRSWSFTEKAPDPARNAETH